MHAPRILLCALALTFGCSRASSDPVPTPDRPKTPAPNPKPTSPAPDPKPASCEGLSPVPCVERLGCILDQPKAGKYVCRGARNTCERAARHADIIGTSSKLGSVTEASEKEAGAACRAIAGCTLAGGRCSCACAVLDGCDCACGGGWLTRCVPEAEARSLEGFPPK